MSRSTREAIEEKRRVLQQARANRQVSLSVKAGLRTPSGQQLVQDRTIDGQIKRAAKSGKVDISDFELERIPAEIYIDLLGIPLEQLSNPPPPEPVAPPESLPGGSSRREDVESLSREEAFNQRIRETVSEPEEITAFKANDNMIRTIELEFGFFGGLKSIDLRNNKISALPNAFADLLRLTSLDLSHNELTALPPSLLYLSKLDALDLSNNQISSLDMTSPIVPSDDGLAYGAGFLSTSFTRAHKTSQVIFPMLREFNLGWNRLNNAALRGLGEENVGSALQFFNLEHNQFQGTLNLRGINLIEKAKGLEKLDFSHNPRLFSVDALISKGAKVIITGPNDRSTSRSIPTETSLPNPSATDEASESQSQEKPSLPIPQPDYTIVYKNCPAATFDSEPLNINFDIYLPPKPSIGGGHALVIWFHGGGLLQGNKENLPPHFRRLPNHPFPISSGGEQHIAVISPNYRLAPQVPILDILGDMTSLLEFVRTKLNDKLKTLSKEDHKIDCSRICLSGGSAGGYLALMGGLGMPKQAKDEDVGGYKGDGSIKCIAPFYPITDLDDPFWATETNPVPWMNRSVSHAEAKPHIDTKAAPVFTAVSGGPRSILYSYMLQHGLFPNLLFLTQRSVGHGLDAFRPNPERLSITPRLALLKKCGQKRPPVYLAYGSVDNKVQPFEKTLEALQSTEGELVIEKLEGLDHAYDEESHVECLEFRDWLGKTLL